MTRIGAPAFSNGTRPTNVHRDPVILTMLLRHSPLFLIGWFPVVLILWAWVDSMHFYTEWRYCRDPLKQYRASSEYSEIGVGWNRAEKLRSEPLLADGRPASAFYSFTPFDLSKPTGDFRRGEQKASKWFPRPRLRYKSEPNVGAFRTDVAYYARVPFWLLLVCYLPLWMGASAWQVRRIRRSIGAALDMPPSPSGC